MKRAVVTLLLSANALVIFSKDNAPPAAKVAQASSLHSPAPCKLEARVTL